MNKKDLFERDTCTKFITPALAQVRWDVQWRIREQVYFTKGRIISTASWLPAAMRIENVVAYLNETCYKFPHQATRAGGGSQEVTAYG